jgi:hypothetical protein
MEKTINRKIQLNGSVVYTNKIMLVTYWREAVKKTPVKTSAPCFPPSIQE